MKTIDENYFKITSDNEKSKPEDFLMPEEKILWKGKPKKTSYVLNKTIKLAPMAILWFCIDFFAILMAFSSMKSNFISMLILIAFFALHLTPFWIWLASVVKAAKEMGARKYIITNLRIFEIKGKKHLYINAEININDIDTVTLRISFIDEILRVGDIYIKTKDLKTIVLLDIPNCEFIYKKLDLLAKDKKSIKNKKAELFYKYNHECAHCGTYYDELKHKCPSCGAPK